MAELHNEHTPASIENNKDGLHPSFIDNRAIQMMKKMGYKIGLGLGKYEQGIKEAIGVVPQAGTQGLGYLLSQCDLPFVKEIVSINESISWLENLDNSDFTFEKLQSYLKVGNPKEISANSIDFCDQTIYDEIIKAKDIFTRYSPHKCNKARARANLFERIYSVFFMNRAALKLANIDAATNFMFSNIDKDDHHCDSPGPFYFADVCAGPGGFSEYLLWRRSWMFKGFGFTLRDENDFQLSNSCCISPYSFQAFYGSENDGNVCCPENIEDFKKKVLFQTKGRGVHFMTSDGGFCVDGNENFQEVLSKNIYLCQCLVALEIVRNHGHFVTKLFDVFTRFSVGLMYLMYKCFKKVSILKPNSSRPANAERYFICSDLQNTDDVESIRRYLRFLSKKLWELRDKEDISVLEIVSLKKIKNDVKFTEFITNSNNVIGKSQVAALKKIDIFCCNGSLIESNQDELRSKCLEYWKIPDMSKRMWSLRNEKIDTFLTDLVMQTDWLKVPPIRVGTEVSLKKIFEDMEEWSCAFLYSSIKKNVCNFYAGFATKTCRWQNDRWIKVKNLKLNRGTLLYGEIVKEVVRSDIETYYKYSLHIIDALYLGDLCLTNHSFQERMEQINIFAESVNQDFQEKLIRIRKKPLYSLDSICFSNILNKSDDQIVRTLLPTIGYMNKEELQEVNSILFLKHREGQLLQSTFVLRAQLFFDDIENEDLFNDLMRKIFLK